jgi:hypothetical protein
MIIECRLCDPDRSRIAAADGGFAYLHHMNIVHRVEEPGRLFPRLFDSASFSYKRLRGVHEEIYHDPLVNLNPQVTTAAAAAALDRRRSSGGESSPACHHACIMCSRAFASSHEVQRHLLAEHVGSAAATTDNRAASPPPPAAAVVDPLGGDSSEVKESDKEAVDCEKNAARQPSAPICNTREDISQTSCITGNDADDTGT